MHPALHAKGANDRERRPLDVGRPIDDIKFEHQATDLDHKIAEAIDSDKTKEAEVQDREGHWHGWNPALQDGR